MTLEQTVIEMNFTCKWDDDFYSYRLFIFGKKDGNVRFGRSRSYSVKALVNER